MFRVVACLAPTITRTCIAATTRCQVEGELTKVVFSRLNLIDLAGSERIRSGAHGGSGAQGEHFKEACHINKSLTTLGRCAPRGRLGMHEREERERGGCAGCGACK